MLKLVVLCAAVAAVAAEPGALLATPLIAPYTYSSTVAPSTTTITKQASGILHPSPYYYSTLSEYTQFIKKRSAPLSLATSYYVPSTYTAATPYVTSGYIAPIVHSTYVAPSPLTYTNVHHLIKKRSVSYAYPSTYIAPTTYATAPLLTTYTAGAHIIPATSVISTAPIVYSHLIKKRSAPLIASAYIAPTSYSTQSRVDVHSSPLITSYSYPLTYHSPLLNPLYYKK